MSLPRRVGIFLICCSTALPAFAAPRHITVEVVVTGKGSKPVADLEQPDFTLLDNKKPQKLDYFQPVTGTAAGPGETITVETIILVDRVNISFEVANDERTRLLKYLRDNNGKLAQPTSMIFFTETGVKLQNATQDGNVLATALEQSDNSLRISRRSQGIQGSAEQAQLSLSALNSIAAVEAKKPGRKMLIWLSAGWPAISGPQFVPGPADHKRFFDSIVDTSAAMLKAHITLYSVDPVGMEAALQFKAGYYEPFMKPVTAIAKAQADNLALQVLVNQTGGRILTASNNIGSQIEDCISDESAYYILSFTAPEAEGPNEYHGLEVKMGKPGLKARTLTGYYAQP